ncbi:hypothetical protein PR003_g26668 [Phytophthora rubi]|uniref:HAT C-terminal dimerisation domain-containing protein n=1 Tax=Phytophthora rubi TaxID=129364 RepID=A0A6A4CDP7_9STRA|nr:hypothetical protein PR003_g26668 [Phytophthora rubi]
MYDAWTEGKTHYVAVIGVTPSDDDASKPDKVLLCFTPFEDETDMGADAFIELFDYVLDLYEIDVSQLVFVTCDHASVNTSFAMKAKIPMLGCASHRLQLGVNRILEPHESLLAKVNAFMGLLNTVKNRAKLRKAGVAMPVMRNATRWSSTFLMMQSFLKIYEHIDWSDKRLVKALPTPHEILDLEDLCKILADLESVSKKLQESGSGEAPGTHTIAPSLADARKLFDGVIKAFPASSHYLAPKSSIVKAPDFESGIVKVITGKDNKLSSAEERALGRFRRWSTGNDDEEEENLSFAERLLRVKGRKQSKFIDLRWIPPTSNDVERLFSKAGLVLTDRRQSLHPTTLETLVMLEYNRSLWDAELVAMAIKSNKRQRVANV